MTRATIYTEELAATLCARISEGRTLSSVCRDEDMPSRHAVQDWVKKWPEFKVQLQWAYECRADFWVDEILTIADGCKAEAGEVMRDRTRIDTRKWIAGKTHARVYGEKVTQEHTGPNGGPLQVQMGVDDEHLRRIAAEFLTHAKPDA